MTRKQKRAAAEILEHFDFAKVLRVMACLGWKWGDKIPTEADLRTAAARHIKCACRIYDKRGAGFVAGGGFVASVTGGKHPYVTLTFEVDSWEAEI